MKKVLLKYDGFVNESVRDLMKPKSEEDVWDSVKDLEPTPMLIKSANNGYMKGVVTALENGADLNFDRGAALMGATGSGNLKIVKYLINKDIDTTERGKGAYLMPACIGGYIDIVKYLISIGLLKGISYVRFYELLDMARNNKHKDIVGLLIKQYKSDQESLDKHKEYIESTPAD